MPTESDGALLTQARPLARWFDSHLALNRVILAVAVDHGLGHPPSVCQASFPLEVLPRSGPAGVPMRPCARTPGTRRPNFFTTTFRGERRLTGGPAAELG